MDLSTSDISLDENVENYSSSSRSASPAHVVKRNQLTALEYLASIMLREIESLKRAEEGAQYEVANGDGINLYDEVQNFEASLIRTALIRAKGVQKRAGELLGVKVTTLNVKIKRYKIAVPEGADSE